MVADLAENLSFPRSLNFNKMDIVVFLKVDVDELEEISKLRSIYSHTHFHALQGREEIDLVKDFARQAERSSLKDVQVFGLKRFGDRRFLLVVYRAALGIIVNFGEVDPM